MKDVAINAMKWGINEGTIRTLQHIIEEMDKADDDAIDELDYDARMHHMRTHLAKELNQLEAKHGS